jgi:hypothetical protein
MAETEFSSLDMERLHLEVVLGTKYLAFPPPQEPVLFLSFRKRGFETACFFLDRTFEEAQWCVVRFINAYVALTMQSRTHKAVTEAAPFRLVLSSPQLIVKSAYNPLALVAMEEILFPETQHPSREIPDKIL